MRGGGDRYAAARRTICSRSGQRTLGASDEGEWTMSDDTTTTIEITQDEAGFLRDLVRGHVEHLKRHDWNPDAAGLDDDVAAVQGRHQEVLDVGQERAAIDRAIEHAGRVDAVGAQRRKKGERSPAAVRHLRPQSLAARCAAVGARHIGFRRGLVDEDQPSRIKPALILLPPRAPPGDRRPVLLAGVHGFF